MSTKITFLYSQSLGILWGESEYKTIIGRGYSGHKEGKNNPEMQDVPFTGPIPRGSWKIDGYYDSEKVGPKAIRLTPSNVLSDRDNFLIHGDSSKHPGEASRGCIIMPRHVRHYIIDLYDYYNHEFDIYIAVIE